jgi:hypothetical protein
VMYGMFWGCPTHMCALPKGKHDANVIMNLKYMEIKRHRRQGFLLPLWDIHE